MADAQQFYVQQLEKRLLNMQSERDKLESERDKLESERDKLESDQASWKSEAARLKAELWRQDNQNEALRKRIRAAAAKQTRHNKRETKPLRGEFHLDCDRAVPVRISQLGAVEDEVLSTLTVSRENKCRSDRQIALLKTQ